MRRAHRSAHRMIWIVLAIALAIGFALALVWRKPLPGAAAAAPASVEHVA